MIHEDTAALTRRAFEASGCKTYREFTDLYGCGLRTFCAWLAGKKRPPGIGIMVLNQAAKGWRPK